MGSPARLPTALLVIVAFGRLGGFVLAYLAVGAGPRDAVTYLAAAERLLSGGDLYVLAAGDRLLDPMSGGAAVPLLYPPLIAVLWIPLSLLPDPAGLAVWWAATVFAVIAVLAALTIRRPWPSSLAILILGIPLTYELIVGNVDAIILGAAVAVWLLVRDGRARLAGAIIGVLGVIKLAPLAIGVWLVARNPRDGAVGLATGLVGALLVGVLVVGLGPHLTYISLMPAAAGSSVDGMSVGSIALRLGLEPTAARAIAIVVPLLCMAAVVLTRHRAGLSFAIAVGTLALATPIVNVSSPSLLLAALAPIAWPLRDAADEPAPVLRPSQAAA
jgi:alpha-1,2-mannosyltransferase